MKKLPFFAGLFFIAATFIPFSGGAYSYRCLLQKVAYSPNYYTEQIPYQGAVMPTITIANVEYGAPVADTAGIKVGSLLPLSIKCATERKQNSAVVSLQAYVRHPETGAVCSLQSLTLDVKENTDASGTQSEAAKQAKFVPSVLASGTWYKIAVTQTGFYKIDRNFLTSIGIDGASANLANLHVHGYGGYMLPENNAIDRPYDLPENATVLSSDGSFVLFY
ncbi:MAG: hypothetical protein EBX41_09955, partial [Chitinophagia bacterium]|nr:hypothetical protein [Chitinophagia bacterium]